MHPYLIIAAIILVVCIVSFLAFDVPKRLHKKPVLASRQELLDGDRLFLERIAKRSDTRSLLCSGIRIGQNPDLPTQAIITFDLPHFPIMVDWTPVSVDQFITDAARMLTEQRWSVSITDNENTLTAKVPASIEDATDASKAA